MINLNNHNKITHAIRSTNSYLSCPDMLRQNDHLPRPPDVFAPTLLMHVNQIKNPSTPAIVNPDIVRNNQCCPIQKIVCASFPCQLLPFEILKKLQSYPLYSFGINIRTCSSGPRAVQIYSFQITDKKRGPVLYMTVM